MSDWKLPWNAACLCGQVKMRITAPPLVAMACHCRACQRLSSSAYSLTLMIPNEGFEVSEGETVIGGLHRAEIAHSFCPHCKNWLFSRPQGRPFVNFRPTMLEDASWVRPYVESCIEDRLPGAVSGAKHAFEGFPPAERYADLMQGLRARRRQAVSVETRAAHRVHGGTLTCAQHQSAATGTPMRFSIFVPPGEGPFPYVIWLSGLTCTEDNFTSKAGAYEAASKLGLAVVAPDTSPRGEGVADDPAYDLGQGAGFYIDATQAPWAPHFNMEAYVTRDLIAAIEGAFPLAPKRGVFGHSMGGHGALTLAMKHSDLFKSVSAFSPICSPTRCPWGEKAFSAYLGADRNAWRAHDAALLTEAGKAKPFDDILIDQGLADQFLENQLKPELLEAAAAKAGQKLTLRRQPGYDHSYFFIATFVADHLAFHAARLR